MTNLQFTNLQFTRAVIKHDAANMDAIDFQQFLEDNDIEHRLNEINAIDLNDGVYDVYVVDFDMPIRFVDGVYVSESNCE
jgi:hypothetical protein